MKKIAFISENLEWGGSEELWSQTAARLLTEGNEIGIFVLPQLLNHSKINALKSHGYQLFYSHNKPKPYYRKVIDRFIPSKYHFQGHVNGTREILDDFNPDLVIISLGYPLACIHWMEECIKRKIPYYIVVQLVPELAWPSDAQALKLIETFGKAVKVFFVSGQNLQLFCKQIAYPLSNAEVIRNPFQVDYNINLPYPSTYSGIFKIAMVARIDLYHKGHDLLMEVLSSAKWQARNLQLSIFGSGQNIEILKRLIKNYKNDNVILAGHSSDIKEIWASNHVFILPSRIEGLPLSLVEAMLCSRACIVTDVGGNTELIEDNVNGFIAENASVRDIDDALERAWMRKDDWENMGKLANVKVKQQVPEDPIGNFIAKLEI